VLKLLRLASGCCFWGQRKQWPRWFWSLFVFSTSANALSGDDKDNGDEGVLCWWSCRPCLCVFLAFDCVVLMVFSALPLSHFFFLSSSPFFFHSDERIKERTPLFPCYLHYPLFSLSFPFFIFLLSPFPASFFVFSVLLPFFFFRLSFSVFSPPSRSLEGAYT